MLEVDGFVSAIPRGSERTKRALTVAAYQAMTQGDREGFRSARAQLRLVASNEGDVRTLSATEASELNALVALVDSPGEIDWDSVYDDPDL
jgi:hypothetical protein